MLFIEHSGDLFVDCPKHFPLAHCVSLDMKMTRGIAVSFKRTFQNVQFLKSQVNQVGQCATLNFYGRHVFYLVTKRRFFHKPSYYSLTQALQALRSHMEALGLSDLGIPGKMSCGLDNLNWERVKEIIVGIFANSNITIHVFHI